jgi:hypothetical protein
MNKRTSVPSVLFGIDLNWRRPQLLFVTVVVSMAGLAACSAGQNGLQELDRKSVNIFTGRLTSPATSVRSYFGIPYAAPPVGNLRNQLPSGVRLNSPTHQRTGVYATSPGTPIALP